jgi:DNA polymerase
VANARRSQLRATAEAAAQCQACDLWRSATQTVFGVGTTAAAMMLVGEQPGDQEDRAGEPFVGPAGRVLADALGEAGVDRRRVYLTNAVKHFKWTPRGKRRIHDRPNRTEVVACRPWLEQELALVDPTVIVALGAIAGQSLFDSSFRVGAARGRDLELDGRMVVATIHPSAVLRARSGGDREESFRGLVADLERAVRALPEPAGSTRH